MDIMINTLIKREEIKERILWLSEEDDVVILININDNSWPQINSYYEIKSELNIKKAEIIDDDNIRIISEDSINLIEKEKRDKAYSIVMYFYEICKEPLIYDTKIRNKYIKEVIRKYKVSRSTVELYLKRYWKRGMTKNSLIPDFYKSGGRGKEKTSGTKKRGKPSKYNKNGINIDENIKKIFKASINKYYNNYNQNTLTTAYNLMIKEYFSTVTKNENGEEKIILKDKIPTIYQFRYWFNKSRDIKSEISKRYGNRIFQQKNRAILGSVRDGILGAGMEYQIDATIGDIYLVSAFNKEWIIGRPVIYAVIDTFSYAIVGINVTLEGPSWEGATGALINSMSEKVSYCKEFGIDIKEEEWCMKHIPNSILADRGEMEGFNADNLVNLGIKVSNTAPYRAEWKSLVEQYFRLLNIHVKPLSPGVVNPDFRERGSKDYRLDAKLNIKDFTKIIIKCVLYHNNHKLIKNYKQDKDMIKDNINPVPSEIWKWSIKNRTGMLRTMNKEELKINLLPKSEAVVTAGGIRFKGIYYSSLKAIEERWFEKARKDGKYKITVAYDSNNLTNIYYINNEEKSYELCFMLNKDNRFYNSNLYDIEYLNGKEKISNESSKKTELESEVNLFKDIEDIVEEAEKRMDGIKFNSSNIKGIRKNRKKEKELLKESLEENYDDKFKNDESEWDLIKSLRRKK